MPKSVDLHACAAVVNAWPSKSVRLRRERERSACRPACLRRERERSACRPTRLRRERERSACRPARQRGEREPSARRPAHQRGERERSVRRLARPRRSRKCLARSTASLKRVLSRSGFSVVAGALAGPRCARLDPKALHGPGPARAPATTLNHLNGLDCRTGHSFPGRAAFAAPLTRPEAAEEASLRDGLVRRGRGCACGSPSP